MNDSLFLVLPDGRSRSQLSLILRELGRQVVSCSDPDDAMRQAMENDYPVAIIDRDLPGVNGLEYVRQVAKNCQKTHVVLLSDEADAKHTPPRAQLGVSDIIYRPFKPARLMAKIEGLCSDAGMKAKPMVQPGLTRAPFGAAMADRAKPSPNQSFQSLNYSPSFMVAKSHASRRLLGNLWNARKFQHAILIGGEEGSEFELVVRELNQAAGTADVYPAVIQDLEVSEEALESLNAKALLSDGPPRIVYIPHIEALTDEQRGAVKKFLARNRANPRRHVRLVLGSVINSDLSTPVVRRFREELGNLCEARLDIEPLRDRRPDIPLMIRKILYDLTSLHSFVRAREVEAAALDYLQQYVWKGNYEQLVTVMRSAISSCPYRALSLHQVQSLLHNDLAALHLLESVADENLLPND